MADLVRSALALALALAAFHTVLPSHLRSAATAIHEAVICSDAAPSEIRGVSLEAGDRTRRRASGPLADRTKPS
ncbi:hypothetical protein [Marinicauda sp. Alg238-R41]|uniref:hypothetical protein n=1 Tax=Marinicauda sp. Alg238-R41 TaxID=2993447 RepID=UPI0022DFEC5E|nr:hypothetical protein [Marinicauda sp. Alg238-R41]